MDKDGNWKDKYKKILPEMLEINKQMTQVGHVEFFFDVDYEEYPEADFFCIDLLNKITETQEDNSLLKAKFPKLDCVHSWSSGSGSGILAHDASILRHPPQMSAD